MKYLPLLLLLLVSGCDWLPDVIDESVTLVSPVVIDVQEPVKFDNPATADDYETMHDYLKPKDKPAPDVKPVPVPKKEPVAVVKPKASHWTFPAADRTIENHLRGPQHNVNTSGMTDEERLTLHDSLHTAAKPTVSFAGNTVTQYTIASCGICKSDQKSVLPLWAAQGWTIQIVDETAIPRGRYPRYEIRKPGGWYREHIGSLQNWK